MIENPEVGMRVIVSLGGGLEEPGRICHNDGTGVVGVELDNPEHGYHDCSGRCRTGHGWYFSCVDMRLEGDEPAPEPVATPEIVVGSRVLVTSTPPRDLSLTNEPGTVVHIPERNHIGVRFDRNVGGHDMEGHCEEGYGWYFTRGHIAPIAVTPPEIVVGSRVRVNGYVGGVGEFEGEGTAVVINTHDNGGEPLGVRFDDPVENGHDLEHHGESMCEDGYGLWVSRSITTLISGGVHVASAPPVARSNLYEELIRSPIDGRDIVPDEIVHGSLEGICRHLLHTDGCGATEQEFSSLLTLISGIQTRWKQKSIAESFIEKLALVDF